MISISAIGSGGCPPGTAKIMGVGGVGGADPRGIGGGAPEGSGGSYGIRMTLDRSTILFESLSCLTVCGVRLGVRKMGGVLSGVLPCLLSDELVDARCGVPSGVCIFVVSVSCK